MPWKKALALKRLVLCENELKECFVKGSGKGGQKINKVRNNVQLTHLPTGLHLSCQKTRSLEDNRRIARKWMLSKLDNIMNGGNSKNNKQIAKLQKQKRQKLRKTKLKYQKQVTDIAEEDETIPMDVLEEDPIPMDISEEETIPMDALEEDTMDTHDDDSKR